jgi:hypothetical protein
MNGAKIRVAMTLAAVALVGLAACSSSGGSSNNTPATNTATTTAPTSTAPAAAQEMTITPDTGLTNGQQVQLVGTGFTAGKSYTSTECADKGAATGAGDCNLRNIVAGTADASGKVTLAFKVAKGPFGTNNIVCSASQKCLVSIATAGSAAPDEVASANITFAS